MKKVFFASMVAALSLLLFSCSNFFSSSSPDNDSIAPNGKALVHFSVGKSGARTIMPLDFTANDVDMIYLSAEKLSPENEYVSYEFSEGLTRLSWSRGTPDEDVITRFQESTIALEYGTYNLKLELCEEAGEGSYKMIQSGEIKAQPINANTELTFIMEYKSKGDISISISWGFDGDRNRIGKIDAGLYTIASMGAAKADDDIPGGAEKTLTITEDGSSATATGSFSSVNNGSYLIKLRFYSEGAENPFSTITDIIKVNGYKTNYELSLEPDKLNLQYKVTFDPNGGTWVGGSTERLTTTRNMYSGFIPPAEVSKSGFVLVGWYSFEDDVPSEDLTKGTPSDRLAPAPDKDYTLYAVWGHSVGGSFTTDNRALIIKTDAGDKIYQNSKIKLSVTDSAGEPVTAGVTYDAKILYKGQDINELGGKTYYTVGGGVITLNGTKNPLPEAKYQLYVTASRSVAIGGGDQSVTSSQTFNVELGKGFATPESQIALYNKGNASPPYYNYLVDPDGGTSSMFTVSFYSDKNCTAFDADGNFYCLNGKTLRSTNSAFPFDGILLSLDGEDYYNKAFVIDLATNTAYAYIQYENLMSLYKYPKLLTDGDAETYTQIMGVTSIPYNGGSSDWMSFSRLVINNNILYALVNDFLVVCDISSGTASYIDELDLNTYMSTTMGLSNPAINDIFALEGAVYILVSESSNGTSSDKNIYRRGSIIKYEPSATEPATHMKNDIKTTPTIANTDITKMTLYYAESLSGSRISDLYTDENERNSVVTVDGLQSKDYTVETAQELLFPDVYALSKDNADEHYLSSPAKVIAVKPKKLVIADDGIAFYTDNDGCLSYKNLNRVVTIDLEEFVVESVQTTAAKFDSEISSYIRSTISLEPLASGGTVVASQEQGYFYVGSGDTWIPIDKAAGESNANTSKTYLSVKPGTTE